MPDSAYLPKSVKHTCIFELERKRTVFTGGWFVRCAVSTSPLSRIGHQAQDKAAQGPENQRNL